MSRKIEYNNAYNKAHYTSVSIRFNNEDEADIIDVLKAQASVKAYIASLIRRDINTRERRKARRAIRIQKQSITATRFEVIEDLPNHDHYSVGICDDLDSAAMMLAEYAQRANGNCGALSIYERAWDPDLQVFRTVRIQNEAV